VSFIILGMSNADKIEVAIGWRVTLTVLPSRLEDQSLASITKR
jgi:hypothetical protein